MSMADGLKPFPYSNMEIYSLYILFQPKDLKLNLRVGPYGHGRFGYFQ